MAKKPKKLKVRLKLGLLTEPMAASPEDETVDGPLGLLMLIISFLERARAAFGALGIYVLPRSTI